MSAAPRWYDPEDDRMCRAAWSRLVEPGDHLAWDLVASHGAGAALRGVIEGRGPAAARVKPRWVVRLDDADPVRDEAVMRRLGGGLLVPGESGWPPGLDDLGIRRPFCLWFRGVLPVAAGCARAIAVVGSRMATTYGRDLTSQLVLGAADAGFTIVSGGAYGIDAAAHRAALSAGAPTVAVLACGADRAYPSGNERLLERVIGAGCVVSEVAPGSAPTRYRFLQRNRLIAALSGAVVVVEAAWRSGALSTAHHGMEIGRPVGACPGPVTSALSAGCHKLLREGAECVTGPGELLELALPIGEAAGAEPVLVPAVYDELSEDQLRIYDALPVRTAVSADAVARAAGLEDRHVLRVLSGLAALGLAEQLGSRWRVKRG